MSLRFRILLLSAFVSVALAAAGCAPVVVAHGPDIADPRLDLKNSEKQTFTTRDGLVLGVSSWPVEKPRAVIVAFHGMNDYARFIRGPAAYWAEQGIATYAIDQRGFGRSPDRGVWADDATFTEDLRTAVTLARAAHPNAIIAVAGESMGGAVAIEAFASDRPPAADRLVLLSPAVWGWSSQPPINAVALWLTAHVVPGEVVTPPRFVTSHIRTSDNLPELIDMGRDRLMIWGARPDALYGLVGLMERAWRDTGRIRAPTAYLYGAHDQVIPARPARRAASRMGQNGRSAFYADGYHLLLVDHQALNVWRDVESFLRDPTAPFPSGAPPLRGSAVAASQSAMR